MMPEETVAPYHEAMLMKKWGFPQEGTVYVWIKGYDFQGNRALHLVMKPQSYGPTYPVECSAPTVAEMSEWVRQHGLPIYTDYEPHSEGLWKWKEISSTSLALCLALECIWLTKEEQLFPRELRA